MIGLNTNYSYMPLVLGNHTVAAPRSKEKCLAACSFLFPFALSLSLHRASSLSLFFPPLSHFPANFRKLSPLNVTRFARGSRPFLVRGEIGREPCNCSGSLEMKGGRRKEKKRGEKMEERKGGKEEGPRRIRRGLGEGERREKSEESCPQNHGESNHNYYCRRIDCGSR